MVPVVMTPRAKEYDSSAGRRTDEVGRRQCRDGSERLNPDLSQALTRQLASQVSAASQQAPQAEDQEKTTHFQKRRCTPVPSSARDSSIEKKLTVRKFYKQSTKRGMQSQDSLPQVVAPLVRQHQPAVVQPQPKRGAKVKRTHGVCCVCEDRQSEFFLGGTTGQTFASARTQRYT